AVELDAHVAVHRRDALARDLDLRAPDVRRAVQDLALEVRGVDDVEVDEPERPDPRRSEVLRERAAEPAGADQADTALEQTLLAPEAELGEDEVAAVASKLVRSEARRFGAHRCRPPARRAGRPTRPPRPPPSSAAGR